MPRKAEYSLLKKEGLAQPCEGHVRIQVKHPFWKHMEATQGWTGARAAPHAVRWQLAR